MVKDWAQIWMLNPQKIHGKIRRYCVADNNGGYTAAARDREARETTRRLAKEKHKD